MTDTVTRVTVTVGTFLLGTRLRLLSVARACAHNVGSPSECLTLRLESPPGRPLSKPSPILSGAPDACARAGSTPAGTAAECGRQSRVPEASREGPPPVSASRQRHATARRATSSAPPPPDHEPEQEAQQEHAPKHQRAVHELPPLNHPQQRVGEAQGVEHAAELAAAGAEHRGLLREAGEHRGAPPREGVEGGARLVQRPHLVGRLLQFDGHLAPGVAPLEELGALLGLPSQPVVARDKLVECVAQALAAVHEVLQLPPPHRSPVSGGLRGHERIQAAQLRGQLVEVGGDVGLEGHGGVPPSLELLQLLLHLEGHAP
eukprot:CAMPEP_0206008880 /NCGR_PEP_ID=MMETSP1464-20131121/8467_1 /ASSEMBLY_ACC=CAM_ASM_001124 /TAXON_ID=119497 /ORGANISM="Exanthemachrysis gayraliae, Strain RCC1523" /LENGTH=317 /DNA_ID=CAMNT_0053382449 /DNA_START=80 /DNA_END=1029 /DNA_ORIENTATION=+